MFVQVPLAGRRSAMPSVGTAWCGNRINPIPRSRPLILWQNRLRFCAADYSLCGARPRARGFTVYQTLIHKHLARYGVELAAAGLEGILRFHRFAEFNTKPGLVWWIHIPVL